MLPVNKMTRLESLYCYSANIITALTSQILFDTRY